MKYTPVILREILRSLIRKLGETAVDPTQGASKYKCRVNFSDAADKDEGRKYRDLPGR